MLKAGLTTGFAFEATLKIVFYLHPSNELTGESIDAKILFVAAKCYQTDPMTANTYNNATPLSI